MKPYNRTMLRFLIVSLLLFGVNAIYAQTEIKETDYTTINGVVKDQQSKKRLEYVNIAIPGTAIGTVTNADGEFTLKINDSIPAQKAVISHLGYYNNEISFKNVSEGKENVIFMIPYANLLQEIVIHAKDPRYIVEEAIKKIPSNYDSNQSLMTGFYRETAQKGKRYINISEAVIDIYKTSYKESIENDRVKIFKGRKLLSQKGGDTLAVKLIGGPNLSNYIDIVKNPDVLLSAENLPYYSFGMEEATVIANRPQYVITFTPQAILPYALYYGKLFIDKEKLSFTKAEFFLDMRDKNKATQAILRKKPLGLRFKPIEVSFVVNYQDRDGLSYLSYISNGLKFKCDWKRKLFSTNYAIFSEMVVTDSKKVQGKVIPYRTSFKASESLSDNVSNFADEDFWGEYNIIEPTESLEHAVNKLKKQKVKE